MINYVLLAFGIFAILVAVIFIFLDKVKGEDIYFNMDVKEQEIKKVIEDADEIISELNYTSEMIVKEIEDKLKGFRDELNSLNNTSVSNPPAEKKDNAPAAAQLTAVSAKKKKITNDDIDKDKIYDGKLNQKQQSVFDYASQGMSVTDIAKQMNIGQGEVMLILSLKNEVE
jgi:DNA-binding NarL/FixJ family response regulator